MFKRIEEFEAALAVVVMVFVLLALPYAVTEADGPEAQKLILLVRLVVLVVFSGAMLIWWLVRYRQTSHDREMLREKIEQTRLFHMRQREIWQKNRQRHSKR